MSLALISITLLSRRFLYQYSALEIYFHIILCPPLYVPHGPSGLLSLKVLRKMANRKFLMIVKRARAGDVAAQLALGKVYLSGGVWFATEPYECFVLVGSGGKAESLRCFFFDWELISTRVNFAVR